MRERKETKEKKQTQRRYEVNNLLNNTHYKQRRVKWAIQTVNREEKRIYVRNINPYVERPKETKGQKKAYDGRRKETKETMNNIRKANNIWKESMEIIKSVKKKEENNQSSSEKNIRMAGEQNYATIAKYKKGVGKMLKP